MLPAAQVLEEYTLVIGRWRLFHLPQPGAFGPVRRDQHPFARQRIVAAMSMFGGVKHVQFLSGVVSGCNRHVQWFL